MACRVVAFFGGVFLALSIVLPAAAACMGVSRTINIRTFNAHLGEAPSASIGLRHKEVVLTFDDGPYASTTPRVLSTLAANCTKATFFVVGDMARANPKLLQKIARSGHTIAHHTQTHKNLTHMSADMAQRNITKGVASVQKALGPYKDYSSKLFRYPYLSRSAELDKILRRNNLLPVSASVMSQDWKSGSSGEMVDRVMARLKQTGRGIILLHDIQPKTASALPLLLRRLKQGGYKIVHIRSGGSKTRVSQVASLSSKAKKKAKKTAKRKSTVVKVAKNTQRNTLWSLFTNRDNDGASIDRGVTGSVKKSKYKKNFNKTNRKTSRKKSTKKLAKKRVTKTGKTGTVLSAFFPGAMKRKPKESSAQYQARLRERRIRLNKKQAALVTR